MTESEKIKESKTVKPSWIKTSQKELENLVIELAKEGKTPAQIGLVLRDKHGIPKTRLLGKGIKKYFSSVFYRESSRSFCP